MLQFREIDISPRNHFPFNVLLLEPSIILYEIEESRVKPHLSTSLILSRLRRLSRALALCSRGNRLSHMSHQKNQNEGDEAGKERYEHNEEKTNPIKSPRRAKMEKKLTVTGENTPKSKP